MGENTKQDFNQNGQNFKFTKRHRRLLYGSVFLMATSAIGPAFLTQTAGFTA
ncbi:divalent metal cation transporter, partial [Staphylococcus warneri]